VAATIVETTMTPAIVLAAGLSTRMGGRAKALLPVDASDTFLTRIVRTFLDAGVDDVVVVIGHERDAVAAALASSGLSARTVVNAAYATGQLSSVIAGLSVVDRPGVAAALVTLVDVPLVTSVTVRAVLEHYRHTRAPIVRPTSGGRHGHPVLIDRELFGAVRAADPGAGLKPIVRAHASTGGDVAVNDPGAFVDVDTPEEYESLIRSGGADGRAPR
jgi:molybdenum cofactor cytidylyltransferase